MCGQFRDIANMLFNSITTQSNLTEIKKKTLDMVAKADRITDVEITHWILECSTDLCSLDPFFTIERGYQKGYHIGKRVVGSFLNRVKHEQKLYGIELN